MSTQHIELASRMGQYLLSRIATGVLVVGFVSFIICVFSYFGMAWHVLRVVPLDAVP